jgi:hypothetical protein
MLTGFLYQSVAPLWVDCGGTKSIADPDSIPEPAKFWPELKPCEKPQGPDDEKLGQLKIDVDCGFGVAVGATVGTGVGFGVVVGMGEGVGFITGVGFGVGIGVVIGGGVPTAAGELLPSKAELKFELPIVED